MTRISLLIVGLMALLAGCASSETIHSPESVVDSLVLEGARLEIKNGTRYNPWLLWNYVTTDYLDGKKQASAVYPGGDINPDEGVCTDLIVRACRKAGYDLQQMIHEDVVVDPDSYSIKAPDKYIDHRRVWVLLRYFSKNFESLPIGTGGKYADWLPGDIVIWDVGSNHHMHIGIISDKRKKRSERPYVIHNNRYFPGVFPGKTAEQDILLGPKLAGVPVGSWTIAGHFRLSRPIQSLESGGESTGTGSASNRTYPITPEGLNRAGASSE